MLVVVVVAARAWTCRGAPRSHRRSTGNQEEMTGIGCGDVATGRPPHAREQRLDVTMPGNQSQPASQPGVSCDSAGAGGKKAEPIPPAGSKKQVGPGGVRAQLGCWRTTTMIDINLLKDEDGIKLVRESQAKRFADPSLVDRTLALYREWTAAQFELNALQKDVNATQKAITAKRKAKESADDEMAKKKELDAQVTAFKPKVAEAEEAVRKEARKIGNLVDDNIGPLVDPTNPEERKVPASDNEDNNMIVAAYGNPEMKTYVWYRFLFFFSSRTACELTMWE